MLTATELANAYLKTCEDTAALDKGVREIRATLKSDHPLRDELKRWALDCPYKGSTFTLGWKNMGRDLDYKLAELPEAKK